MTKRRTGQLAAGLSSLIGLAVAFCLPGGASPGNQEIRQSKDFLVAMLLKTAALREQIAADIQESDREIQTSERIFLEAEKRMTNATETRNREATWEARGPLDKARSDLKKAKQARARLDQAKARADATYDAVRGRLVPGQSPAPNPLICCLVSLHSGKAKLFRKNGEETAFDSSRPRFLEPGDEIMTMRGGRVAAQVLDGRASVLLDEHSRLKLEENGHQGQILRLVQGRIYSAVDKPDDFAAMLRSAGDHFEADPQLKEAVAGSQERIQGLTDRRLILRTSSACCSIEGARFIVDLKKDGGTEITVLEAALDAGEDECSNQVLVEEGFKVTVTKGGISEPQTAGDSDAWWKK